MPAAASFGTDGKKAGEVELAPEMFGVQVNVPVLHEVVRAQLAAARAGTHATKTRGDVRGGGRKPWRQKGTGRARHGSTREPQWVGGGVAHGPQPRDYSMRVNRKTRALALRSALTDRAREGKVIVVEMPEFTEPSTSRAVELLEQWGAHGRTLLVAARSEEEPLRAAWKSFRNLPDVLTVSYPTAYTVLAAATVIFTNKALQQLTREAEASSFSGSGSIPEAGESRRARESPAEESSPSRPVERPASASRDTVAKGEFGSGKGERSEGATAGTSLDPAHAESLEPESDSLKDESEESE